VPQRIGFRGRLRLSATGSSPPSANADTESVTFPVDFDRPSGRQSSLDESSLEDICPPTRSSGHAAEVNRRQKRTAYPGVAVDEHGTATLRGKGRRIAVTQQRSDEVRKAVRFGGLRANGEPRTCAARSDDEVRGRLRERHAPWGSKVRAIRKAAPDRGRGGGISSVKMCRRSLDGSWIAFAQIPGPPARRDAARASQPGASGPVREEWA